MERKRRPWYSWRRWPGGLLLFGVAAAVVVGVFDAIARHQDRLAYDAVMAELDAEFPNGWRMEQLAAQRPDIPPEQNAALALPELRRQVPESWPGEPLRTQLRRGEPPQRLSTDQAAELRQALEAVRPALERVRGFTPPARGRILVQWTDGVLDTNFDDFQAMRRVAWLLAADAADRSERGDVAGALEDCRVAWHALRWLRDEPGMIQQLVRMGCAEVVGRAIERALAQATDPPAAALAELSRLIAEDERVAPFPVGLVGETAQLHLFFENAAAGRVDFARFDRDRSANPSGRLSAFTFRRYHLRHTEAYVLRFMARAAALDRLPEHQRNGEARLLTSEVGAEDPDSTATRVGGLLVPAFDKVMDAALRYHAWQRSLLAVLAAERYRLATGRRPESFTDLAPRFLAEAPRDPFDGKPLRFRPAEGVLTVYSVNADGMDNEGLLTREGGAVLGVSDIGYQLWDVDHRRQPPPARPKGEE